MSLSKRGASWTKKEQSITIGNMQRQWWARLAIVLNFKFGAAANGGFELDEDLTKHTLLCDQWTNRSALLERVCQLLGFEMILNGKSLPTLDSPITPDSLRPVQPTVKHLNLISLAEAKVLHLAALTESPFRACEMLRRVGFFPLSFKNKSENKITG